MTDKTNKEKDYTFRTTIEWTTIIPAESKEKAVEQLKQSFIDEFNIEITEKEFELLED